MNRLSHAYRPSLWFKRWSRRSDAAFLSIGKVVHIGSLKVDICRMAMLKSGVIGAERLLLQLMGVCSSEEELDPDISEWVCEQELLQPILISQVQVKTIPAAASVALGGVSTYLYPTLNGASACSMWDFSFCNHFKNSIL